MIQNTESSSEPTPTIMNISTTPMNKARRKQLKGNFIPHAEENHRDHKNDLVLNHRVNQQPERIMRRSSQNENAIHQPTPSSGLFDSGMQRSPRRPSFEQTPVYVGAQLNDSQYIYGQADGTTAQTQMVYSAYYAAMSAQQAEQGGRSSINQSGGRGNNRGHSSNPRHYATVAQPGITPPVAHSSVMPLNPYYGCNCITCMWYVSMSNYYNYMFYLATVPSFDTTENSQEQRRRCLDNSEGEDTSLEASIAPQTNETEEIDVVN